MTVLRFLIVVIIFVKACKRNFRRFDDESGKGTVRALDLVFHLFDDIIGETDALVCCGRNGRDAEFFHVFSNILSFLFYL